jgi:hypothetical protein
LTLQNLSFTKFTDILLLQIDVLVLEGVIGVSTASVDCGVLGGKALADQAIHSRKALEEDDQVEDHEDGEGRVAEDGVGGEGDEGEDEALEEF